jgi:ribosomal protein S18 acetylase RimI-like enzyme
MRIRRAELVDLNACSQMDLSYSTDTVWQVDERPKEDGISVTFRTVKLPRAAQIRVPKLESGLLNCWQQDECFVIAEGASRIVGFLNMPMVPGEPLAHIRYLVVDTPHRRKGVGSALITSVAEWARDHGVGGIMAETDTRNYPAISFLERRGFAFCGYSDQLSVNQGVKLFFIHPLR